MLQTVMIADDSIPLHSLVKAQLGPDCLNVHSVYDGEAAVATAVSLRPDLILLDVDMPNMDGFEACRRIKADPATSAIPLIFLSAHSIASDKMKGLGLGAVDYIIKPFKPDTLLARVRSTLQPVRVAARTGSVDPLTGLGNKTLFDDHLREQLPVAEQTGGSLACTVIEIDQLSSIGSKCGPRVTNQIVRRIAGLLSDKVGEDSKVYCLPSRRFVILTNGIDRFAAVENAKQLLGVISQRFVPDGGMAVDLTFSIGVSDSSIAEIDTLLDRAGNVVDRVINRGGNSISMARAQSQKAVAV